MKLDEIFRKYRKTEPKSIIICRNFVMIIIVALLMGYSVYLIINILNDVPTLKTQSRTESGLRLPTMKFTFDYKFIMTCAFAYYSKSTVSVFCL